MYNDITGNVVCKDECVLSNMCSKLDFRYEKLFSDVYSIWSRDNITYTNATIDTIRDYCKSISLICLGSEGRYYHVTDTSIIPAYSVLVDDVIDYLMNCDELTLETVREAIIHSDLC